MWSVWGRGEACTVAKPEGKRERKKIIFYVYSGIGIWGYGLDRAG
jgi:hypothetical protein